MDELDVIHDQVTMREELGYWERIAGQRRLTGDEQGRVVKLQECLKVLARGERCPDCHRPLAPEWSGGPTVTTLSCPACDQWFQAGTLQRIETRLVEDWRGGATYQVRGGRTVGVWIERGHC